MTCPVCGGETRVVDSATDCERVYRKRRCVHCAYAFTTTEQESKDSTLLRVLRNEGKYAKNRKN